VFLNATANLLREKAGYRVVSLEDGTRTLEVARTENPDVIALDIYMPGKDGPAICRELKQDEHLQRIPVLFLTGAGANGRFKARCLEEGADDFLAKSAATEELIARLQVLYRIKRLQDELRRERDELEEKVRRRARELKEKETLAAIGKMVAGVAHEIRNPLGAISNSAAVLSRDLSLEGEDEKLMNIIVKESDRLRETINDFLKFAHPAPYVFLPVDLKQLVEDVFTLARRDNLCGDEVELVMDIPDSLPAVEVDQDRMHQVLWNLIRNSLEALRGKGKIEIRVSSPEEDLIRIRVADDGPGVREEDREQVFEPFFTRKARGSGLGLAMVRSAVSAHGGSVRISSHEGGGTIFEIELPARQTTATVTNG
jgi:signal transduction histidine kinase